MKNKILLVFLGITFGFLLTTVTYWLLNSENELIQQFIAKQITHYVTLIAAGIALYGAFAQIQSNVNADKKVRMSKLDAAKAVLPIILSNISQICTERYFSIASGKKEKVDNWRWEMTNVELSALKECIEYSAGVEKERMLQICRIYQALIARWESLELENLFSEDTLEVSNLSQVSPIKKIQMIRKRYKQFNAIQNWAVLEAITISLFDFSRGEESNPTYDKIVKLALDAMSEIKYGNFDRRIWKKPEI